MVIYQRICQDLLVSTDPNTYIANSPLVACGAKASFGGGKLARSGRALCNAGGEGIPHAQGWWQHGGRLPGWPRLTKWCARSGLDRAVALQFGYASGVHTCRSLAASSAPMCSVARPFDPSFVHGWSEIGLCGHGRCERLRTAVLVFFAPTGAVASRVLSSRRSSGDDLDIGFPH
jgi:hypothetical protein